MAIVKKNTYDAASNRDLTNLALVVDLERLGFDLTHITIAGSVVTVKAGSLIECNGSMYAVEGSDITLTLAAGVLAFDSSTLTFSISSSAFPYDAAKCGEYISSTKRACRWTISADGTSYIRAINSINPWYAVNRVAGYKAGTDTQANWFTYFAALLPVVGQVALCTGGIGSFNCVSTMTRTSSTIITVTGFAGNQTFTSGTGTNVTGAIAI
jgi:hypothetical protein